MKIPCIEEEPATCTAKLKAQTEANSWQFEYVELDLTDVSETTHRILAFSTIFFTQVKQWKFMEMLVKKRMMVSLYRSELLMM